MFYAQTNWRIKNTRGKVNIIENKVYSQKKIQMKYCNVYFLLHVMCPCYWTDLSLLYCTVWPRMRSTHVYGREQTVTTRLLRVLSIVFGCFGHSKVRIVMVNQTSKGTIFIFSWRRIRMWWRMLFLVLWSQNTYVLYWTWFLALFQPQSGAVHHLWQFKDE